jgi:glyoxylase-like metal-dependent hydrolase (beta-lactamase superfamily II)
MNNHAFVFNPFYENTYVLWDDALQAIIIDPGCYEKYELDELDAFIQSHKLTVIAVVNTHCHIDHVLGNDAAKAKYKTKLWVPVNEKETYRAIPAYAPSYGFTGYHEAEVDEWYAEGMLHFGEMSFQTIEVPGHSPGHMVLYHEASKTLIGGDVLFRQSIGRTDLPGGNHDALLKNIKEKLYTLPNDVTVYPGHGPKTTIGFEKQHNPFVNG